MGNKILKYTIITLLLLTLVSCKKEEISSKTFEGRWIGKGDNPKIIIDLVENGEGLLIYKYGNETENRNIDWVYTETNIMIKLKDGTSYNFEIVKSGNEIAFKDSSEIFTKE